MDERNFYDAYGTAPNGEQTRPPTMKGGKNDPNREKYFMQALCKSYKCRVSDIRIEVDKGWRKYIIWDKVRFSEKLPGAPKVEEET